MTKKDRFLNNEERTKYLESQFEKEQEFQEAELLIDVDQAIKEEQEKNKQYKIVFRNKSFYVPSQMPFNFSIFFFRYCFKKINGKTQIDVPETKLYQFIQLMLGENFLKSLETSNDSFSLEFVFETIASKILKLWGYDVGSGSKNKTTPEKKI